MRASRMFQASRWQARSQVLSLHSVTTPGETDMRKTDASWNEEIDRRREALVALRRDFHRHPELSFEERRTAEIVADASSATYRLDPRQSSK